MDALLARYLDGELDDDEARAFAEAVSKNPELEAELRRYEQLLSAGRDLDRPAAPADFTRRVMDEIGELEPAVTQASFLQNVARRFEAIRATPGSWRLSWAGAAVVAAALILAFLGGIRVGQGGGPITVPGGAQLPAGLASGGDASAAGPMLHVVRLVYVPRDQGIERVTVAGTFNDWKPEATALRRVDGLWSTTLVLPPGSYEYMFVENGEHWKTDPLATITRDDGFGNVNAVLDLGA
jgi:hypothetical protein